MHIITTSSEAETELSRYEARKFRYELLDWYQKASPEIRASIVGVLANLDFWGNYKWFLFEAQKEEDIHVAALLTTTIHAHLHSELVTPISNDLSFVLYDRLRVYGPQSRRKILAEFLPVVMISAAEAREGSLGKVVLEALKKELREK